MTTERRLLPRLPLLEIDLAPLLPEFLGLFGHGAFGFLGGHGRCRVGVGGLGDGLAGVVLEICEVANLLGNYYI